ncbi:MAG: DUF3341 domain-containing protein [Myxococcota bacterium]
MSGRVFVAYFDREEAVLAATRAARDAGLRIHDVHTPYAVHGMDEAMGLPRSRLGVVCFAFAALGLLAAVLLQWWTSAVDWPLNVGGKPPNSAPAFVPVAFEVTVLLAALGTVATLFVRAGLAPWRAPWTPPRATNDRFALVLGVEEVAFHEGSVRAMCARHGAVESGCVEVSS